MLAGQSEMDQDTLLPSLNNLAQVRGPQRRHRQVRNNWFFNIDS